MQYAVPSHPITSLHLFAAGEVKLSLTQARVFIGVGTFASNTWFILTFLHERDFYPDLQVFQVIGKRTALVKMELLLPGFFPSSGGCDVLSSLLNFSQFHIQLDTCQLHCRSAGRLLTCLASSFAPPETSCPVEGSSPICPAMYIVRSTSTAWLKTQVIF